VPRPLATNALYRDPARIDAPRAQVSLSFSDLTLQFHDGSSRWIDLDGCANDVVDATFQRRFVRMLTLDRHGEQVALITPPDHGAIAPRVAHLPAAPDDAAILPDEPWQVVVDWVHGGGRLCGLSVAELARLTTIATSQFALIIGEVAAQVALEMVWEQVGPWRGGAALSDALGPLQRAARGSERAAEALVAALAACAAMRQRARIR
jgi:hypothetical protein